MKQRFLIISILLFLISLPSCNILGVPEEDKDLVATQVAVILTETALHEIEIIPTETFAPSPSPTETIIDATPTETPTVTQTKTPTQDQDDPAQRLGTPAWTYDFSGNSSPWDFDSPQATFSTTNGALNITAKNNANWHSWWVSSPSLQNAYVEATIEMNNCSGLDRFGLIVRASNDGDQFYFTGITCDGRWGFFRMEPGVNIQQIQAYSEAAPLKNASNSSHRIGIWMEGSNFTIYIDGEKVGNATDNEITGAGYTGFLVAFANTSGFTVRVDELRYWNIP